MHPSMEMFLHTSVDFDENDDVSEGHEKHMALSNLRQKPEYGDTPTSGLTSSR